MELLLLLPDVPHALQDLSQVSRMRQQLVPTEKFSFLKGDSVVPLKGRHLSLLTIDIRVSVLTLLSGSTHIRH